MAQVIEKTQTDAYIDFVAKYPDIKIGQRTFDKLKPFFTSISQLHTLYTSDRGSIFYMNRLPLDIKLHQ
jgi:hypothetical protein